MKKKGFTLIELLAVIVVLAIIALIAIPIVLNIVDDTRKGAFKNNVKIASNQIEMYLFKNGISKVPAEGINVVDLDIKSDFIGGSFKEQDGKIIAFFIENKGYCAYGPLDNLVIKKDCDAVKEEVIIENITYTVEPSGWATSKTVNINYPNGLSDSIDQICYYVSNNTTKPSLDDEPTKCITGTSGSNSITITEPGKYVFFRADKTDGVSSDISSAYSLYVAPETPTKPVITGSYDSNLSYTVSLETESLSLSGIKHYEYFLVGAGQPVNTIDLTKPTGTTQNTYTKTITGATTSLNQVYYRAIDNNGNASELSNAVAIVLDNVKPTISSVTGTSTTWATSRTLKVSYSSNGASQITQLCYYVSDSTTKPSTTTTPTKCVKGSYSTEVTITEPGKYVFFKADKNYNNSPSSDWSSYYNLYVSS